MAFLRTSCYNPTSLILVLTIHKRLPQPVCGTQHAHDHCCCGGCGRQGLGSPRWPWPRPAGELASSWPCSRPGSGTGEMLGAELSCEVLPHLLSARFNPSSLVLPPKASRHRAFIVRVCQKKVPFSGGEERKKRGFVLLCWMDKCSLMKEPHPRLPAVSLPQHCPHGVPGLVSLPACPRTNPGIPALGRASNAPPALLWFISCFVGAKLQLAAYYNCSRNSEGFSGIAAVLNGKPSKRCGGVQRDKVQRVADGHPSPFGCSGWDLAGPGRLASSLPRGRLHLRRQTVCPAKSKGKGRICTCRVWGLGWVFSPPSYNKSCPEVVRLCVCRAKITLWS